MSTEPRTAERFEEAHSEPPLRTSGGRFACAFAHRHRPDVPLSEFIFLTNLARHYLDWHSSIMSDDEKAGARAYLEAQKGTLR